jgi:formylglycine-generating enzyme required for sulfatase activity
MPSGQTSLEFVTVGDAGNAADPATGSQYGAVAYVYRMGKYDVTNAQYAQFLNAVADTDTYGLWHSFMGNNYPTTGITRSGSAGSFTYSVVGDGNVPIADVTWGSAARFANWLHNGQPAGLQAAGTTETGAYTLNGAVTTEALTAVTRNSGASYFIPSQNEWYKSAYYKGGGISAGYWKYATQSDTIPSNVLSALGTNNANFVDVNYTDAANYLTPVGAFASSPSAYGTYDQSGLLFQWTEAVSGNSRTLRGGSWEGYASSLPSSYSNNINPSQSSYDLGFRMAAAVPEPGSFLLLIIGGAALLIAARRRKG